MDTALLLAALRTPKPEVWQRLLIMQTLGYQPWEEQARFHFDIDPDTQLDRRHKMVTGGEQAGKSFSAAMELMTKLFWGKLFWIVAPDYSQAENEFNYLQTWLTTLGLLDGTPNKPQKGSWQLSTITGQVVVTKSAKDVATIAGKAPDGILFVEAAQAPYEAFLRCYGRTGPSRGWLCINGTFEKDTGGWFRNLWKAAQTKNPWRLKSFAIPSWDNLSNYPGGREDVEIKSLEAAFPDADHFMERFGGVPAAPKGLVHKEFDYTLHVKDIHREGSRNEWDADAEAGRPREVFRDDGIYLPVDTDDELWIDPGFQFGYAVLWVTVFADCAFVYDEHYKTGLYSEQMADLAMAHPRYERVARIVMDISGNTHAGGNKSASQVWYEKTGLRALTRAVGVSDGIERTRISLHANPDTGLPQLFFDPVCVKTCWEYAEGYRFKMDRWGDPMPNEKPEDKNNHSAKAIAYGLTINFGPAKREQRNKAKKKDKLGQSTRTVAGWEMLYENEAGFGQADAADYDDNDYGYDPGYEEYDE